MMRPPMGSVSPSRTSPRARMRPIVNFRTAIVLGGSGTHAARPDAIDGEDRWVDEMPCLQLPNAL